MPSPEGDNIMDSAFIYQAANELVKNAGTRNIKQIARSCSLDISETSRIKDMLGLLSLYFDKPVFFSFSVFFCSSIAFWMDAISVFRDAIVSCFSTIWDA